MNVRSVRPSSAGATRRVWEIADQITRQLHRRASRAEVIRTFTEEGGNPNTASTQYHHWKTEYEAGQAAAEPPRVQHVSLQVKEGGRVLLPADLRAAMGIAEGDSVVGELRNGELRLMSRSAALLRAQDIVTSAVPQNVSLVDQLLAERRAEVERGR